MCLPLHGRRKDHLHIEPIPRDYGRLPRVGKHSRGKSPRVLDGQTEARPPNHSYGVSISKEYRRESVTRSVREGTSIAAQRAQDRLVADFVKGLSGKDFAFAVKSGLLKSGKRGLAELADKPAGPAPAGSDDRETDEPALGLAHGGLHNRRPMHHGEDLVLDTLEPEPAALNPHLTEPEIAQAHDDFSQAIAWVHEARILMKKGHRLAVLIAWCRPDLAESLPVSPGLRDQLEKTGIGKAHLAIVFGRVFAWAREAASISALGIRANIIAYVVQRGLLDEATNAEIGREVNNTRAAINKLVQEFREAFKGIRTGSMRDESTRHACRRAQYADSENAA